MLKITNPNYIHCSHLLYAHSPSFSGILAGECKGDVWVDNITHPTLALVYSHPVGGFSIMGSPDDHSVYDAFADFIRNDLFPDLRSRGENSFEFSVEDPKTEVVLLEGCLKGSNEEEIEYTYTMKKACEIKNVAPYRIMPLDRNSMGLIEAGEYEHPEMITERLLYSWESADDFFGRSVAYVACLDKTIVGVIMGTGRFRECVAIDIEVRSEHRNKGLASALTGHFVNECVARGLTANWCCVDSNIASRNTVEKMGFEYVLKKPVYGYSTEKTQ